jgi:LacI family transcriptional regulator
LVEEAFSKRKPTQFDVARVAGVSQAMVAYVINNRENVAPTTRQRVLEAIDRLGYVPDRLARGLRTGKTNTIALVLPDISNPFYPVFGRAIQNVADQNGYDLIMYNSDGAREKELRALKAALQMQVDGLIMVSFHTGAEHFLPLLRDGKAVVVMGCMPANFDGFPIDSLCIDDVSATQAAVNYLFDRGYKRIGHIGGTPGVRPADNRLCGYRNALTQHGVAFEEALAPTVEFTEEGGYQAMRCLLELPSRPRAVFASNDLQAFGAISAIRDAGLTVPEDIAVMGFDDIPAARLITPALTTVSQDQKNQGTRAAEMLFARLAAKAPPIGLQETLPYRVVIRQST